MRNERRRLRLGLAAALGLSTVLRLAVATRLPLGDDEAYYWLWASHLTWGYPDHPPIIAFLVAAGLRAFGDSALAVRSLPLLLSVVMLPLLYVAARALFDRATAQRAVLLAVSLPAVAIGGAFAFPDTPLVFFWLLAVWTGWRALSAGGWWWVAAGLAVGLAVLSKLTAAFLVVGMAGAWLSGDWRRSLRDPGWYAGVLGGAALAAVVVIWNIRHDWLMLQTIRHGAPFLPGNPSGTLLSQVIGQVLYFGPLVIWLLAAVVLAVRRRRDPVWRYLVWLSVPLLLATALSLVAGKGRPHWPAPGYLAAAIALAAMWPDWRRRYPGALRVPALLTPALTVLVTIAGLAAGPAALIGNWGPLAARVAREAEARGAFVLTGAYQTASQLNYMLRGRVLVTSHLGAFPLWDPPARLAGRNMVFASFRPDPTPFLGRACRSLAPLGTETAGPGRLAYLYSCEDFSGSYAGFPLPDSP